MTDITTQAGAEYDQAQIEPYDLASAVIDWVATPSGAQALFEAKITPDHFDTRVSQERIAREILEWVYDYKDKYDEWPISQRTYEHFRQHYVDEDGMTLEAERPGRVPVEDVIERLHTRKLRVDSLAIMEQYADRGNDDLLRSLSHCITELTALAQSGSYGGYQFTPTDMTGKDILDFYDSRSENGSLTRITTGFPLVDKELGGYRGFTAIEGRPGGFKSWLTMISAHHAAHQGHNVVLLTLELTADEVMSRYAAYVTQTGWNRFDNALLTKEERVAMQQIYDEERADMAGTLDIIEPEPDQMTLPALKAIAENYGATAVYVDQFSLIDIPGKFPSAQERDASICRPLKRWANSLPGALVVAHQRNREADKKKKSHNFGMDTSANTDKIMQFADLVVATSQLEDQRRIGAFTMGTVKARNGPSPQFDFATSLANACSIKCVGLASE